MTRVLLGASAFVVALAAAIAIASCGDSSDDVDGPQGTPLADVPVDFWGIAPFGASNASDLARMSAGGVGSYRVLLSWPRVETTEGTYDWSSYDLLMEQLATNGMEPLPYVFGTPRFHGEEVTEGPASTDQLRAWSKFVRAAAVRYGPDGAFWRQLAASKPDIEPQPFRIWEIWNEPNSSLFWTPKPDPDDYARLLTRSADVIGGVDPEAEIMVGGMFATPNSPDAIESPEFIERLFDIDGVDRAADLVGVHPYGPNVSTVVDQMDLTVDAIDAGGGEAGTWITELGWGSDPGPKSQLSKTPEQQATLLTRSFEKLSSRADQWDLHGVIWFTWADNPASGAACGWCPSAGLVDSDRDSKPAWIAYTDFTGGQP